MILGTSAFFEWLLLMVLARTTLRLLQEN